MSNQPTATYRVVAQVQASKFDGLEWVSQKPVPMQYYVGPDAIQAMVAVGQAMTEPHNEVTPDLRVRTIAVNTEINFKDAQ